MSITAFIEHPLVFQASIERPVIDEYGDDSPNDDDRGTPTEGLEITEVDEVSSITTNSSIHVYTWGMSELQSKAATHTRV